jgi:chromosome segregation ATPase
MGFTGKRDREVLADAANGKWWFVSDELRDAAHEALSEISRLKDQRGDLQERLNKLLPLEGRNAQLVADNAKLVEDNATLRAKLEKLEADARVLVVDIVGVEQKAKGLEEQLYTEKTKVLNLTDELKTLRGSAVAISRLEAEKAGLETELDKCRDSYGNLAVRFEEASVKLRHADTRLTVVEREKLKVEEALTGSERERLRLESLAVKLSERLDDIRDALDGDS